MNRVATIAAVAAAILAIGPARANDSTAQAGTGGLLLVPTYVKMAKEKLTISRGRIDIDYEYVNDTDRPLTSIVAFPLPVLEGYDADFLKIPQVENPENFVDFTVTVDGRKVEPKLEQRASMLGMDVTERMKADGLPINIFVGGEAARDAFKALPKEKRPFYESHGIAAWTDDNDIDSLALTVSTTFYWEQTFPAHSTVKVSHSYKPVFGQGFLSKYSLDNAEERARLARGYRMDKGFETALRPYVSVKPGKENPDGSKLAIEYRVDYVLKTALNWGGPIGEFELNIVKPDPTALLTLCWKGALEKVSPTTFRYRAKDFRPTEDISIMYVDVARKVE